MAAKKRTTKKATTSIVEPKATTSSNGRRIASLVIVVLGIIILWRNGGEETEATMPASGSDTEQLGPDVPQTSSDYEYEYIPQSSGSSDGYTPQSTQ